jgi:addiction module HigA family antidote
MAANAALVHPGEILLTEFMEPLGLTAYRLAKDLAVPAPRVGDIVRGKRAISADTALRLGIYFGLPAQFWLNLQNEFDLRRAAASPALKRSHPCDKDKRVGRMGHPANGSLSRDNTATKTAPACSAIAIFVGNTHLNEINSRRSVVKVLPLMAKNSRSFGGTPWH